MSATTKIEWTDTTWNTVTGCTKVSAGCANCYAEMVSKRTFAGQRVVRGSGLKVDKCRVEPRRFTDVQCHEDRLDQPLRWRKPRRVAVCSMSDLFHESVGDNFVAAIWSVMAATPRHTYQILTKRPERMRDLLSAHAAESIAAQPNYERRPIPGWEGYYADTNGAIWSGRRGEPRLLSPCVTSKAGHAHVSLHSGAGTLGRQIKVHRLVLMTFDRMPKDGEECRHLNGDPSDNRISNLRWGTRVENSADRTRHGNAVTRRTLSDADVASVRIAALQGETNRSIGERLGVSHTQVCRIVSAESWPMQPLPNVWLGVSVEDQETADKRIPILLDTPAAVRFVSYEPALGPVDFLNSRFYRVRSAGSRSVIQGIDWLIVGGETGPKARPCDVAWIRSALGQFLAAGVPCFVKQLGSSPTWDGTGEPGYGGFHFDDGRLLLRDRKGGDPAEWPEDLRVREFPR